MVDIVERLEAVDFASEHWNGVQLAREARDEIVRLRGCVTMTAAWERRALDAEAERDEWRQAQKEAVESRERWHELYLAEGDRAKSLEAERDRLRDAMKRVAAISFGEAKTIQQMRALEQIADILDAALKGDTQ